MEEHNTSNISEIKPSTQKKQSIKKIYKEFPNLEAQEKDLKPKEILKQYTDLAFKEETKITYRFFIPFVYKNKEGLFQRLLVEDLINAVYEVLIEKPTINSPNTLLSFHYVNKLTSNVKLIDETLLNKLDTFNNLAQENIAFFKEYKKDYLVKLFEAIAKVTKTIKDESISSVSTLEANSNKTFSSKNFTLNTQYLIESINLKLNNNYTLSATCCLETASYLNYTFTDNDYFLFCSRKDVNEKYNTQKENKFIKSKIDEELEKARKPFQD